MSDNVNSSAIRFTNTKWILSRDQCWDTKQLRKNEHRAPKSFANSRFRALSKIAVWRVFAFFSLSIYSGCARCSLHDANTNEPIKIKWNKSIYTQIQIAFIDTTQWTALHIRQPFMTNSMKRSFSSSFFLFFSSPVCSVSSVDVRYKW